jgi:hypothetical protein
MGRYGSLTAWFKGIALAAFALAAIPNQSFAQSDTTSARMFATISPGVTVDETNEMLFGWLARPASPGLAQLSPSNQVLSSGLTLMKGTGTSPATVVISGSPNQALGLLLGERASFGAADRRVSVTGFTHNGGPIPALGPDGRATIELGATLRVMTNARDGRYRGVFDVIVTNN